MSLRAGSRVLVALSIGLFILALGLLGARADEIVLIGNTSSTFAVSGTNALDGLTFTGLSVSEPTLNGTLSLSGNGSDSGDFTPYMIFTGPGAGSSNFAKQLFGTIMHGPGAAVPLYFSSLSLVLPGATVPEPSAWLLMGLGIGSAFLIIRKQRSAKERVLQ